MSFHNPKILFLSWLIPLFFILVFINIKKTSKTLKEYISTNCMSFVCPYFGKGRLWMRNIFFIISFLMLIIAASGPLAGYKWKKIQRKGIDIVLALDCSKSMLAKDINPNRLIRAKRKIIDLLKILEGDRVALVAFSGVAFMQCPLTLDYEAFNIFLDSLDPKSIPVGGTNLEEALRISYEAFNTKIASDKAIILITDGEQTKGAPFEIAKDLKAKKVKVFTIGIGAQEGTPIPDENGTFQKDKDGKIILSKLDEKTLETISIITGGEYIRSVTGDMDLKNIYFKNIKKTMTGKKLKEEKQKIWENRFQIPLFIGFFFFLAGIFFPIHQKGKMLFFIGLSFLALNVNNKLYAQNYNEALKKGYEAYNLKKYEEAAKNFTDAQLDNPDDPKILYNIANSYYKSGKYDLALKNYTRLLKTQDKQLTAKALYNIGNSKYKTDDYDGAIEAYEQALKINPNDEDAKKNIDFIKKKKEQKKQEQNQNKKNDSKEKQNQQKQEQDKSQQKKDNEQKQKEKEQNNQENQEEKPKQKNQEQKEQKQKNTQSNKKDGQGQNQAQNLKQDEQDKKDDQDKKMAEKILNRLKDAPQSNMMMRTYPKEKVEKDW